jgi:hypothetical protein
MPTKNLRAARYITSELAGLQGEDLREKQARLQELLDAADLQQQAMEPNGEASGTRHDNRIIVAGQKSHKRRLCHPIMARWSTAGATELPAKAVETIAPSTLATTAGSPEIRLRSPASRAIPLGQMRRSRHAASPRRKRRRLQEPTKAPKVTRRPAHT